MGGRTDFIPSKSEKIFHSDQKHGNQCDGRCPHDRNLEAFAEISDGSIYEFAGRVIVDADVMLLYALGKSNLPCPEIVRA